MFVVINVTLKEVSRKCSITFDFIAPCSSFKVNHFHLIALSCGSMPCQNGGTCYELGSGTGDPYFCDCPDSFNGTNCEVIGEDKFINVVSNCGISSTHLFMFAFSKHFLSASIY